MKNLTYAFMTLLFTSACSSQPTPFGSLSLGSHDDTKETNVKARVVILPDTQHYTRAYIHHLQSQVEWIIANKDSLKIDLVLTVGDIVHNNTDEQWQAAEDAFKRMNGIVPYVMTFGNHDYGDNGTSNNRDTLGNHYFSAHDFPAQTMSFRDRKLDNTAHVVTIADQPWLVLSLEWGPRDEVLTWAKTVSHMHADLPSMMVTHAYLYSDGTRYDKKVRYQRWNPHDYAVDSQAGSVNDGQELWEKLVSRDPRMKFVFSGHVLNDGQGFRSDHNESQNAIHQMAVNFQMLDEGGMGYLRILEFLDDDRHMRVKTYSPVLDRFAVSEQDAFTITL